MSRTFNLLIFDWDGTLMDSEAKIVDCVRAAAEDLDLGVPADDRIRNIIGLGLTEAVTTLFPGSDDEQVQAVARRYRHHFLAVNETPSALFPGAVMVLEALADRDYLLAVATGKGRQGLDRALADTGLARLFHATRCADETLSKPHPEMLHQLMNELGAMPGETLMVGDTEYDMQMAVNAGTERLAVSYGVHAPERLQQHRPLGCLDSIGEMVTWLDELEAAEQISRN